MASRLTLLLAALALAACARTTLSRALAAEHEGDDATAELDFWDAVAEERALSNHDALYALLLHFELPADGDYAALVKRARDHGWLPADEAPPALETARTGWIAKAVCIEAGIAGGLTMRVLGPKERYAVRELNHRRWLPDMSTGQAMSGLQLLTLLGKVDDAASGKPDKPREDL